MVPSSHCHSGCDRFRICPCFEFRSQIDLQVEAALRWGAKWANQTNKYVNRQPSLLLHVRVQQFSVRPFYAHAQRRGRILRVRRGDPPKAWLLLDGTTAPTRTANATSDDDDDGRSCRPADPDVLSSRPSPATVDSMNPLGSSFDLEVFTNINTGGTLSTGTPSFEGRSLGGRVLGARSFILYFTNSRRHRAASRPVTETSLLLLPIPAFALLAPPDGRGGVRCVRRDHLARDPANGRCIRRNDGT
jgi:hypothetical protein